MNQLIDSICTIRILDWSVIMFADRNVGLIETNTRKARLPEIAAAEITRIALFGTIQMKDIHPAIGDQDDDLDQTDSLLIDPSMTKASAIITVTKCATNWIVMTIIGANLTTITGIVVSAIVTVIIVTATVIIEVTTKAAIEKGPLENSEMMRIIKDIVRL